MVKEAEQNAEADRKRRDVIDLRNRGERLLSQVDTMVKEYGEKIPEGERGAVESAMSSLRSAMATEDADALQTAFTGLEEASRRAGESIYRASSEANATADESEMADEGVGVEA